MSKEQTKKSLVIGIPASKYGEVFGASVNNLEFIRRFGEPRLIMPHENMVEVDALYLGGGADMETMDYGEVPQYKTGNIDPHREYFYKHKMKAYIEARVPIFGVCLGMQQLAVYFGSKLTQDAPFHAQSAGRWVAGHKVYEIKEFLNTKEEDDLEFLGFEVNSHHHQYVGDKDLGKDLEIKHVVLNEDYTADLSESPYIVESFKHKTLPIVAVQWHPEELYDTQSMELFTSILPK